MPGRIEAYLHSDALTENKGGCLVRILCETDFAAKTQEFRHFCKKVAVMSFAYGSWEAAVKENPDLGTDLKKLEEKLGEKVDINAVTIMTAELPEPEEEPEAATQ